MDTQDYIEALKSGVHLVRATTKKGEERTYIGALPADAEQRIANSDVIPILCRSGEWKSFSVTRVTEFTRLEVGHGF
jgi:hypothetical protein